MKSTRSRCELSPIKSLVNRFNSDAIAFFLIIDRLTIAVSSVEEVKHSAENKLTVWEREI